MSRSTPTTSRSTLRSFALIAALLATAALLGAWKYSSVRSANAAAANQMEPMETVAAAVAAARPHQASATAIGTVLASRSITLRNEVPGTVHFVGLQPGRLVNAGAVLVALDVSVETAELRAQEAQARLAQTNLDRVERMTARGAASAMELDNSRAERDVALAQTTRTRALIARKTIRAPFRARVGMSEVHRGQFLEVGTQLTTLQGVDGVVHVDFPVSQAVAAGLRRGQSVRVVAASTGAEIPARVIAVDARVDPATRNAVVRAELPAVAQLPSPGSSVRVEVPVGPARDAVVVPVSALRKGPGGDHVFVIGSAKDGKTRAQLRLVKTGPVLGDEIIITEGLTVGERVAASGSFKLRDAALVAVTDTGAKTKRVSAR